MPLEENNVFLMAAKRLNLRTGPGTHFGVRRVLSDSQKLSVIDVPSPGWCKVKTPDGETGFVAARFLRKTPLVQGS